MVALVSTARCQVSDKKWATLQQIHTGLLGPCRDTGHIRTLGSLAPQALVTIICLQTIFLHVCLTLLHERDCTFESQESRRKQNREWDFICHGCPHHMLGLICQLELSLVLAADGGLHGQNVVFFYFLLSRLSLFYWPYIAMSLYSISYTVSYSL